MNIELKELVELFAAKKESHSIQVGQNYLIRTVTNYYTGQVKSVTDFDIVLENAAWIADTGRFHDALKNGTLNELEPFVNDVIISRASIVDMTVWNHPLPRTQK